MSSESWLLPKGALVGDAVLAEIDRRYVEADAASVAAAGEHRRNLMGIAGASTVLTLAFLLYDEANATWLIVLVGIMLAAQWLLLRAARRTESHRRYVDNRVLAECLRVQAYLRYAGSPLAVADLLTWSQRDETAWVEQDLRSIDLGDKPGQPHDIGEVWIEGQRSYHERAARTADSDLRRSEGVVRLSMVASVALYLVALAFEASCGTFGGGALVAWGDPDLVRTLLKIVLGAGSAATLFVSGYYDKLSLARVHHDHEKMERLFAHMADRHAAEGQTPDLLESLAREELIENANWYSYQQDNAPQLGV